MATILQYTFIVDKDTCYFECNSDIRKALIFYKLAEELVNFKAPWNNYWNEFDLTLIGLKNPTLLSDKADKIMDYVNLLLIGFTNAEQYDNLYEAQLNEKLICFFNIASNCTQMKINYIETESII